MNAIERRQYQMLLRVRDFGDSFGERFPPSSVARENFAAVAAAIKELDAQDVAHMAASLSARAQRKDTARQALLARLQAISQTARVLRQDKSGLVEQFEVPAAAADQTLLTTGRKFARDAEAFSTQFIAHGMPVTFLTDLNALVDSFESALRDRGLGSEARRAARLSTKALLASGIAAVRSLDAVVNNHLGDDEVTRTVWKRERRIVYPKRPDATLTPAPVSAAPEPPTGTKAA
jgi:hypothetical protein